MCSARWSEREKHFSQWLHLKGFEPVCLRKWRVSSSERAKLQVQSGQVQMYGFSPVVYGRPKVQRCVAERERARKGFRFRAG